MCLTLLAWELRYCLELASIAFLSQSQYVEQDLHCMYIIHPLMSLKKKQDFCSLFRQQDNFYELSKTKRLMNDIMEPQHEISSNVVFVTSKVSDQPAHMCSLIRAASSHMNIQKLLSY